MRDVPDNERADFLKEENKWRALFAEVWGTFLLVLAGAGAVMAAHISGEVSKGMEAVAPALMVMAAIYFMGAVSGAHLNPAVTIAFAVRRHFPWVRVPFYIAAQITGAVLAASFLKMVLGNVGNIGATVPHHHISDSQLFLLETVLTTGLVNTILGTASGPGNVGNNGALAIGGYIALAGFWAGPLTAASMNAARTLGPDIVRGDFSTTWIYVFATLLGGIIAVGFEWMLKGKPSKHADEEAQGAKMKDAK